MNPTQVEWKYFFSDGAAPDPAYVNIRDLEWFNSSIREEVERMWQEYSEFCPDNDFLSQARVDFNSMGWQMQLTVLLKKMGFNLQKCETEGPDICFLRSGIRHWVEAVSANKGDGDDAVPIYHDKFAHPVPEDQIILRLRSVIEDKFKKYQGWIKKNIIDSSEPFIIAINAGKLILADLSPEVSFAEKAVFPIGKMGWSVEVGTGKASEVIHTFRDRIIKRSDAEVKTDLFMTAHYGGISGIMFSPHHFSNSYNRNGADFTFIHNPNSNVQVPRELFQFGRERWVECGELRGKDWPPFVQPKISEQKEES